MLWMVRWGVGGRGLVEGGIAAGKAVAHGSSRGAACAGSPGFAWPEWRIDVSPGLFARCGATSDGHAHRRMAAFRSSRVSLGIPDTATAPAVPYVSGPPTVTTAWRLPGLPAPATIGDFAPDPQAPHRSRSGRSEEHTSELQSLMRISYAVFCLKKKNKQQTEQQQL